MFLFLLFHQACLKHFCFLCTIFGTNVKPQPASPKIGTSSSAVAFSRVGAADPRHSVGVMRGTKSYLLGLVSSARRHYDYA